MIAGDLFHRQPLLRELREVNALFGRLSATQVVFSAGNHDYVKKDSYYRTFSWDKHVHMILEPAMTAVELPEIETAVYGFSYYAKELEGCPYQGKRARHLQKYEVLLLHGGDQKHVPLQKQELLDLGYDYIALGHIHMPMEVAKGKMAYSGALEPTDRNDLGQHGYVYGEITEKGCKESFVPFASREYIQLPVDVTKDLTGYGLKEKIRRAVEERGTQNIYKILLQGFRDPQTLFDLAGMDGYGNIIEWLDETKPAYDMAKLKAQNPDNLLGKLIDRLGGYDEDSVEYRALCEGVQALLGDRG